MGFVDFHTKATSTELQHLLMSLKEGYFQRTQLKQPNRKQGQCGESKNSIMDCNRTPIPAVTAANNVICKSIKSCIHRNQTIIQFTKHNQITLPVGINVTVYLVITAVVTSNKINKIIPGLRSSHLERQLQRRVGMQSQLGHLLGNRARCLV